MIIKTNAIIFGYNEYSKEIVKNIKRQYKKIVFYVLDEETRSKGLEDRHHTEIFKLDDDWSEISEKYSIDDTNIFCTLNNDAQNVFLTISLRSEFENANIISLARSRDSVSKLNLAGATKVMPVLDTATNVIVDLLENPIANKVINDILYSESDLELIEVTITEKSPFINISVKDIDWSNRYGIKAIAFYTPTHKVSFIYDSKVQNHRIELNDIFIIVGYKLDLINFQKIAQGDS